MLKLPARVRISSRALLAGGIAVLCVAAVIVGLNVQRGIEAENAKLRLEARQAEAQRVAGFLISTLRPYAKALDALAQDPGMVTALASADDQARQVAGENARTRLPGALRLRLVPRDVAEPDRTSSPPLTFASIDLMRNAAHADAPPKAEVHLAGTPDEHIVMIRRVPPAGEPLGFLHLSLDPGVVRDAIAGLALDGYAVEVRQTAAKGGPVVVGRRGQARVADADMVTVPIAGTAWTLTLRDADGRPADGGAAATAAPVATGLLLVAVVAGFIWWTRHAASRRARHLVGSGTDFQGAIKAIMGGEYPGLEELLPGHAGAVVFAAPGPERHHDEIITEPAYHDTGEHEMIDLMPDSSIEPSEAGAGATVAPPVAASIFRSYDIRGVVGKTLTTDAVYQIGRAIGSEAGALDQQTVIVARDGRVSSVALHDALVSGLRDSGRDVLDIGLTPSPVLYFATNYLDTRTGVMITGSHNPPEYNGLKMVLNGQTLSGDAIQAIRRRIEQQDFSTGHGSLEEVEIIPDYIRRISEEIPVSLGKALKVVVDCGNGVPGIVAPHILRAIGHDVIELYCEVDGDFPNHHPDPSQPENLEDLITIVRHEDADLGLAFDGDGDRLGVVDREGNILWPDRQMMLFARDVLSRNPGAKIIYDVKCSRLLTDVIREAGGEPIMWKTGHSLIKSKMKETGALLAGEMSGHIFFKERWYGFDDALYSAARLLEILVNADEPPEAVFARLPGGVATPELRLDMPEERHAEFMEQVRDAADFPDGTVIDVDGLRVDFPDSWGLIRASNTTPCLVLRFEGDGAEALERVKQRFRRLLLGIDPALELPF